jgi:hypothetical protein
MSKEDRDRADARFESKAGGNDRDAASKAVLDNMARLKALRLAREASAPSVAAKKPRAKSSTSSAKKTPEKGQVLADWLAGRQSGGHRT